MAAGSFLMGWNGSNWEKVNASSGAITIGNTGLTALSDSIYADSFSGPSKGIVVAGVYDDGVSDPVTKFLQTNSGGKLLSVIEDGGNTITVDGTVAATQSGTWILGANSGVDIGDVTINNASIAVTGTFWQATQPVSIASAVPVTDNSGSLTVDAPVGTPVFVRLSDGASAISTLPVSLASVPSHPVTNAGTFAVQVDGAALTSLQLLDDTVATAGSAALTKLNQVGGTDGTNARILSTNASGHVNIADGNNSITVDAPVATPVFVRLSDGASAISTLPVSLATVPSHPVTNAGTFAVQVDGAALTSLQLLDDTVATAGSAALTKLYQVGGTDGTNARILSTNTSGHVNIADGGNIITVDGTVSITANSSVNMAQIGGTNTVNGGTAGTIAVGGIQAHDAAISGNNPILCGSYYAVTPADVASGDVTRTWASPKGALLTGAKYEASPPSFLGDTVYHLTLAQDGRLRVDFDVSKVMPVAGNVAHDAADTGNPIKLGARAIAHGTNPTAVADADRTNLYANRHGILWTIGGHPNLQSAEYITTAAQTSGGDNVLPLISAGTRYVITGVTVTASAANTVNTSVRLGFGTTGVPTQGASGADAITKVILSHPGIAPGSGVSKGHAGGIVGIGGDGEELYIVCSVPTGGSVVVQVDYYTIES
jgi:hypothetical protein